MELKIDSNEDVSDVLNEAENLFECLNTTTFNKSVKELKDKEKKEDINYNLLTELSKTEKLNIKLVP